jgi:hypothetical protein
VLILTLHQASYDWAFEREDGTVLDSGSTPCHSRPPLVATADASQVTASGAVLTGTVDPNGLPTSYHFDYGTTTAYGAQSPTASASSGAGPVGASASIGGLAQHTAYHYRLVANNVAGTIPGNDMTFTTGLPATPPTARSTGSRKVAAAIRLRSPSRGTTVRIGTLPRGGVPVTPAGLLLLPLACPAVRAGCETTVTLSLPPSHAHRRGVMLTRIRRRHLAPGARVSLRVLLPRARLLALELTRGPRRLKLRVRLDSTFVGGIRTTRTFTVVVRLPARRR